MLKGATVFAADLMRQIAIPFVIDFISASSYRDSTRSSGTVLIRDSSGLDIRGHRVILIEDIVDTGLTVASMIGELRKLEPASLDVCALLHKRVPGAAPVAIRYKGFDVPDVFVVGYGMDYAERYRNLPGICRLILDPVTGHAQRLRDRAPQLASDTSTVIAARPSPRRATSERPAQPPQPPANKPNPVSISHSCSERRAAEQAAHRTFRRPRRTLRHREQAPRRTAAEIASAPKARAAVQPATANGEHRAEAGSAGARRFGSSAASRP